MNRVVKLQGFTIVELTLAMGFVSALLLAIAMTVIQIGNTYNRGITYKNVNQSGSLLIKEIQNSINGSEPFSISGAGSHFIDKSWGGRLCAGQYSYIWNYGSKIDDIDNKDDSPGHKKGKNNLNTYTNSDKIIRFIKVYDPGSNYCSDPTSSVDMDDSVELLDSGQHDLAIHDFNIPPSNSVYDSNTMQRLYNIEFSLGTNNQDALKTDSGYTVCKDPSEKNSDLIYCSVSRFRIVARAGNSVE